MWRSRAETASTARRSPRERRHLAMLESRAVRRSIRRFARAVILLAFATTSGTVAAQQVRGPSARDTTSATLSTRSATDDHREMMARLGIKALRPGPSGNEQDPNHANYDEAKANPFTSLPDALTLKNGQRVTTRTLWATRRAELLEDFEREVYGRIPKTVPKVTWELSARDTGTLGGRSVIGKHLTGHVDNSAFPDVTVAISLTLVVPNDVQRPVPVMIMFRPGTLEQALGRPPSAATRPSPFTPRPPAPGDDAPA